MEPGLYGFDPRIGLVCIRPIREIRSWLFRLFNPGSPGGFALPQASHPAMGRARRPCRAGLFPKWNGFNMYENTQAARPFTSALDSRAAFA